MSAAAASIASLMVSALNVGILLDAAVELAQEVAAVPGVIFPGVFAVEDQADGGGSAVGLAIADHANAAVQILGCGVGAHAAVDEADQDRKCSGREKIR